MSAFSINRRQMLASLLLAPAIATASDDNKLSVTFAYNAALDDQLIIVDIRTPHEWRRTGIPLGAHGIDMDSDSFFKEFLALANEFPEKKISLISTTGGRSAYLSRYLARRGVLVYDIPGGIIGKSTSWKSKGLPFRKYR